jgi:hypothetical protein
LLKPPPRTLETIPAMVTIASGAMIMLRVAMSMVRKAAGKTIAKPWCTWDTYR